MKNKFFTFAAIFAAFFMLPAFSTEAYVGNDSNIVFGELLHASPDLPPIISELLSPEPTEAPAQPFTPEGTGTVLDNANDEDGKEFFTITTPDENVFYLIIDRQRATENVYFLNAVTEADLLSLATIPERPEPIKIPIVIEPPVIVEAEPIPEPVAASTQNSSNGRGMLIIALVVAFVGGVAGWYFKIYLPKQHRNDSEEDYGDWESEFEDDAKADSEENQ